MGHYDAPPSPPLLELSPCRGFCGDRGESSGERGLVRARCLTLPCEQVPEEAPGVSHAFSFLPVSPSMPGSTLPQLSARGEEFLGMDGVEAEN